VDISGLYWRKSALSARECPPGLLALSDGRVSFTTATGVEFDEAASDVSGSLTPFGSLVVRTGNRSFVLIASAGQLSIPFTAVQHSAITAAQRSHSLRTIDEWPAVLTAAGATFTSPRRNYRPWLLGGIFGLVIAGVVLAYLFAR
jgi:hypothetical protein